MCEACDEWVRNGEPTLAATVVRVPSACVLLLLPCGLSPTDGRVSDVGEAVDAIAGQLSVYGGSRRSIVE